MIIVKAEIPDDLNKINGCLVVIVQEENTFYWIKDTKYHRNSGPAIVDMDCGDMYFYQKGKTHCLDGPAVIMDNGKYKEYYVNDIRHFGKKEWQKAVKEYFKLKSF